MKLNPDAVLENADWPKRTPDTMEDLMSPEQYAKWKEEEHPRDNIGQFTDKGKGVASRVHKPSDLEIGIAASIGVPWDELIPEKPSIDPEDRKLFHENDGVIPDEEFFAKMPNYLDHHVEGVMSKTNERMREVTKNSTGLDGEGVEKWHLENDEVMSMMASRAWCNDNNHIAYSEQMAREYMVAMDSDPVDWDITDMQAVSGVIHENIHSLGEPGYRNAGTINLFMEEASTETLARMVVEDRMAKEDIDRGIDDPVIDTFRNSGPYTPEVAMFREIGRKFGIHPEQLSRELKNRDDAGRLDYLGEMFGVDALLPYHESNKLAEACSAYVANITEMDRSVYGWERLPQHRIDSYQEALSAVDDIAATMDKWWTEKYKKVYKDNRVQTENTDFDVNPISEFAKNPYNWMQVHKAELTSQRSTARSLKKKLDGDLTSSVRSRYENQLDKVKEKITLLGPLMKKPAIKSVFE